MITTTAVHEELLRVQRDEAVLGYIQVVWVLGERRYQCRLLGQRSILGASLGEEAMLEDALARFEDLRIAPPQRRSADRRRLAHAQRASDYPTGSSSSGPLPRSGVTSWKDSRSYSGSARAATVSNND